MASVCCRARVALRSTSTKNAVVSKLFGPKSPSIRGNTSKSPGFTTFGNPNSSPQRLFSSSRLPVELGCVQSLMPLHSVTASALLTSLLSLHAQSWGSLSEAVVNMNEDDYMLSFDGAMGSVKSVAVGQTTLTV